MLHGVDIGLNEKCSLQANATVLEASGLPQVKHLMWPFLVVLKSPDIVNQLSTEGGYMRDPFESVVQNLTRDKGSAFIGPPVLRIDFPEEGSPDDTLVKVKLLVSERDMNELLEAHKAEARVSGSDATPFVKVSREDNVIFEYPKYIGECRTIVPLCRTIAVQFGIPRLDV